MSGPTWKLAFNSSKTGDFIHYNTKLKTVA